MGRSIRRGLGRGSLVPLGRFGPDAQPTVRVPVGRTVRRKAYSWSPAVLDLLGHLEREGFAGAPRALGLRRPWPRGPDLCRRRGRARRVLRPGAGQPLRRAPPRLFG